ncbi:LOW QUALITY PROTEIN: Ubiquitinyl hydrolase [Trema orientale]|uniref:Ubiquitinyl hydrolase n=1 Tax=Trema orientale TaxID=63057 RepID=A0A2P5APL3_TREOI|nr:LOW QUALITY PROTEIN: Ubiquitinyl hydrolase [Trema orientale]
MKIWIRRHSNPHLTRRPRLNPISRTSSNETLVPSFSAIFEDQNCSNSNKKATSHIPPETDTRTTREGSRVLMANGYFGLENFGNTCYCNSVIQRYKIWVIYIFIFGYIEFSF